MGAGRKGFVNRYVKIVNLYHPDILFCFMKNKVNSARANVVITKFDFPFFIEITPIGFIEVCGFFGKIQLTFAFKF